MKKKEGLGVFKFIFTNELKKIFTKKNLIGFIVIAVILQIFLQVGKYKYLDNIDSRNSLQKVQEARVTQYAILRQYATFGISLMFVPSQFSILYNDSTYDTMVSNVNAGSIFNIYLPKKGKELFSNNSPFMNFLGISLLMAFYFCIVFGIDTTHNIDYMKCLSSFSNPKKIFKLIVLIRIIVLNFAFLILFLINMLLLLIDHINLFRLYLLPIFWGLFLVITSAFSIGCILGRVKLNSRRNIAFFLIYIVAVLLLPMFLNFVTMLKAENIKPVFEFEYDNLTVVMAEEKKLIEKHGVLKPGEIPTKEIIIDARKSIIDQAKELSINEEKLKNELKHRIKNKKIIASLFPVLFYLSINEDIATNGNESFIDFYTFSKQKKLDFVSFCVDRLYPLSGDPQVEMKDKDGNLKVENFIKGDEYFFFARSKLPAYFWQGSLISLLWIAALLAVAYRKSLKGLKGKPGKVEDFDVEMKSGEFNYLLTADEGLKNRVYNYLAGERTGERSGSLTVKIDNEEAVPGNFIYLYKPGKFHCDVDKTTLQKALMGNEAGTNLHIWQFLVRYAADSGKILVLDNSFVGLKIKEVKDIIKEIGRRNAKTLYMGENIYEAEMLADNLIFSEEDESIEGIKAIVETVNGNEENPPQDS